MQLKITRITTGDYALHVYLNTPFGLNQSYLIYHQVLSDKELAWFQDCIINSADHTKDNYNEHLNGVTVVEIADGWLIEEKYNQLALAIMHSKTI